MRAPRNSSAVKKSAISASTPAVEPAAASGKKRARTEPRDEPAAKRSRRSGAVSASPARKVASPAKKAASPAKKSPAKKSPTKKSPAKKSPAAKKATAAGRKKASTSPATKKAGERETRVKKLPKKLQD
eukprot:TRINITY_DN259_c0_g1_i1.p1 TRINITY_DN259_c0_g1~~TRINITY_DN259_c0_g1_i1.p1  ORF type:complete len:129 (+),score=37.33 TRINITY_DN259_c0_g1_i1:138-524(+)